MQPPVHPRILELCNKVTAKRPLTVIKHILEHGSITTEELQTIYHYDHPPRAIRDVREQGIPLDTFRVTSRKTGRKIAAYRFGNPDEIKRGRIGGRKAFSKQFKTTLIDMYGARDAITSEPCEPRYLQIDHRVPYEVAGDSVVREERPDAYMLLDASSQRAKSWSCERCANWQKMRDVETCRSCFWAYPETYTHIALEQVRRIDIQWRGSEVAVFEKARKRAQETDETVAVFIKRLLAKSLRQ